MNNYNLAKLTLSVLFATQLLSVDASAASQQFSETLLTRNELVLNNLDLQIGKPIIKEISEEEALEFINEEAEDGLYTKVLTIPKKPIKPIEDIILDEFDLDSNSSINPKRTRTRSTTLTGNVSNALDPMNKVNSVIMAMDKLVALGQKIAPIIMKGKSVVSNSPMNAISVVPLALSKEYVDGTMENWSLPKTKSFTITYPNGMGMTVAKFVYTVTFQYGGTYKGKGAYLTGIRSAAKRIDVSFGFDLDAKSQLVQISNIGRNGKVVAGAMIQMEYTVSNFSRVMTNVDSFFLTGDGRIIQQ